ncbi:hypothetical protein [Candidatus Finniella inopinata]|uniref:hypothetical protein n=1 Tax=Candidatus Finniella inopinata TaxID=1696036 RepID=UPI0013EEE53A|nr:hypothetical protein [Candidatus Finniella inopinata]
MSRKTSLTAGFLFFISVMSISAYGSALLPGQLTPYELLMRKKENDSSALETSGQREAAVKAAEALNEESKAKIAARPTLPGRKRTASRPFFSSTTPQTSQAADQQVAAAAAATKSDKDEVLTDASATQGQTPLTPVGQLPQSAAAAASAPSEAVSQTPHDDQLTQGTGKTRAQKDEDERERLAAEAIAKADLNKKPKLSASEQAAKEKKEKEEQKLLLEELAKKTRKISGTAAAASQTTDTPAPTPTTPTPTPNRTPTPTNTATSTAAPIPITPAAAASNKGLASTRASSETQEKPATTANPTAVGQQPSQQGAAASQTTNTTAPNHYYPYDAGTCSF